MSNKQNDEFYEHKREIAEEKKVTRCHWCGKYVGGKGQATVKEPNIYYCRDCYKKGLEMEYEAMGRYDARYKDL